LKTMKKLSFGERRMMDQCKELIIKEIAISSGSEENSVGNQINSCFDD